MNYLKSYAVAGVLAVFLLMASFNDTAAQNSQKNYNNNGKTVSVKVQDLEWSDVLSYGAIKDYLSTSFAGGAALEVDDLVFSPDFKDNAYYLSFSLEDQETTKIVILDVAGNEIHSETIEDFEGVYESKVNLKTSAEGTYFLKVIQGFSLLNKKLVIEK